MAEINFELDLPPGINSNETTFAAKGRWVDGDNVRFVEGRPQVIENLARLMDLSAPSVPSPRAMLGRSNPDLYVGCAAALFRMGPTSSLVSDISPVGLIANIKYWALDNWGDDVLAAPQADRLYVSTGGAVATHVSQAPLKMNDMLVTSERQVMAIGCNEEISGTFNALCVRWSDIEDYSNWTTSSTNHAGEHILEGEGKLVAGRLIGPYIALWTDGSLFMAQFIGDPGQTYRFDKVADGCGLLGAGAVAVYGQTAYWMSQDHNFWVWSPGMQPQQVPCPLSGELRANILVGNSRLDKRTFAVTNSGYEEVWWFYPDIRSATSGNHYVALSLKDGSWFKGTLDRRAGFEGTFLYQPGTSQSARDWRPMITADETGWIYAHEADGASNDADGFSWFITSADQYIESGRRRVQLQGVYPDFESQYGDVFLTTYLRDRAQAVPVAKGPYTLTSTGFGFLVNGTVLSGATSILVDSGTGRIAAGQVVTFAGVNGWVGGADSGSLARFTLTSNLDEDGGDDFGITPAMIDSGESRNVVALPADNAAITMVSDNSKTDFRASGKLIAVKLAGAGPSSNYNFPMRFGKPVFHGVTMGQR